MSDYVLQTPLRKVKDPTSADIDAALAECRSEGGVAVLENGEGSFVQFDGRRVEVRHDEAFYRVDLEGVARRAFTNLLRGGKAMPETLSWREASAELDEETSKARSYWRRVLLDAAILLGLIGVAFVVGVILLRRATGAG